MTLFTNQYFHGGLWGTLHYKSVKPKIEISDAKISNVSSDFTIFRTQGVDVYGSFIIGIEIKDKSGNIVLSLDNEDLSKFPKNDISNFYVAKVATGKHSLVVPLGSKATLTINENVLISINKGVYNLTLIDISGATWDIEINNNEINNNLKKIKMKKYLPYLIGIILGALAGYLYWRNVGCATGTCPITSSPIRSAIYGAVMGGLLGGMFKKKQISKE